MADGTSLRLLLDTSAVLHLASGTLSSAAADALRSGGLAVLSAVVPWELLGRSLDDLVANGLLPADRREGAELKAWSVVHGFASLALAGHSAVPTGRQRHAALESTLEFAVLGLCAPTIPPRTS